MLPSRSVIQPKKSTPHLVPDRSHFATSPLSPTFPTLPPHLSPHLSHLTSPPTFPTSPPSHLSQLATSPSSHLSHSVTSLPSHLSNLRRSLASHLLSSLPSCSGIQPKQSASPQIRFLTAWSRLNHLSGKPICGYKFHTLTTHPHPTFSAPQVALLPSS